MSTFIQRQLFLDGLCLLAGASCGVRAMWPRYWEILKGGAKKRERGRMCGCGYRVEVFDLWLHGAAGLERLSVSGQSAERSVSS